MGKLRFLVFLFVLSVAFTANGQILKKLKKGVNKVSTSSTVSSSILSNADYIKGLKEALSVATNNSSEKASMLDGFYKNDLIKIAFPEDAIAVKKYALKIGLDSQVAQFEEKLNRAAELAAKKAAPVFLSAIQNMTITDAMGIAKGDKNAATLYLRKTSGQELAQQFQPIVSDALNSVSITKYWKPLADSYNKVSFFMGKSQVNPDLDQYVTQKAVDGLFVLIENEEANVRKDPLKYGSDLLDKIFTSKK